MSGLSGSGASGPLPPGRLAENIVHFARALRRAGLPVGPGTVLDALEAVQTAPFTSRADFHAVLQAVFVKSREQAEIFDGVFAVFWRRRGFLEQMIGALSPAAEPKSPPRKAPPGATRVADALFSRREDRERPAPSLDLSATFTTSGAEVLRAKDFAQMTAAEVAQAVAEVKRLTLPLDERRTRRFRPDPRGARIDPRRSFRRSLRAGGAAIDLARRAPAMQQPPIVAICDISGSVADYSRVFLHFLHALSARRRVHGFLFGTRLSNVSRSLAAKDVDAALASCGAAVSDWSGGTRIATSLHAFNKDWLRRVAAGATVLLFTDGLEREAADERPGAGLGAEMDRLRRSCRRLIWLNPLLRYGGFEAKAAGIRTMLPFVDEFRPIHNLISVADLCAALDRNRPGDADPRRWLAASA